VDRFSIRKILCPVAVGTCLVAAPLLSGISPGRVGVSMSDRTPRQVPETLGRMGLLVAYETTISILDRFGFTHQLLLISHWLFRLLDWLEFISREGASVLEDFQFFFKRHSVLFCRGGNGRLLLDSVAPTMIYF
jgi:hypothetical protein